MLLVEDNPNDVVLVEIALENHGISHTLHVVNDGKAAIDFVKTIGESGGASCPDVFLLDISIPQVNGLEVLGYVRAHAPCSHTPVIVFSSLMLPEEQERLAALDCRFFRKPIRLEEFMKLGDVVKEVVGV